MSLADNELQKALKVVEEHRIKRINDALLAADLLAAYLNVIREDHLASQVLDMKATIRKLLPNTVKESPDAMDLLGRPPTHQSREDPRQAEAMGQNRERSSGEGRRRSLSDPSSEQRNSTQFQLDREEGI